MKIVLAIDAIKSPLTGIGRYALELADRLSNQPGISDIRYFSRFRFIDNLEQRKSSVRSTEGQTNAFNKLFKNRVTSVLYGVVAPVIQKKVLSAYKDYIYHSPNFCLPVFPGKSIATFHDLSIYKYPEYHPRARVAYMEKQIPLALKRADYIITVSESARKEIIDYFGWPSDKIISVPNGVSFEYRPNSEQLLAEPLARFGLKPGGYSLCVATIEPRKNIHGLLEAFALLPLAVQRRWPLVLAGSRGWNSEKLHARIEEMQAKGSVKYLGYVPEHVLPILFAGARAFLFPSFYEGFGIPIIEAMSCGVPVLTSNCSSLPEVAGGAAHLIEPENIQQMSDGIRLVLEDESWRSSAIYSGFQVAQRYSWERTAIETVNVYKNCYSS